MFSVSRTFNILQLLELLFVPIRRDPTSYGVDRKNSEDNQFTLIKFTTVRDDEMGSEDVLTDTEGG